MKSSRCLIAVAFTLLAAIVGAGALSLDDDYDEEELLIAEALKGSVEEVPTASNRRVPSGSRGQQRRLFSSQEDEQLISIPPVLVTNWGLALVDGAEIKKVLDEENDIGVSFEELSQFQLEFGKRTESTKKRKESLFNLPGSQVKPSHSKDHINTIIRTKPKAKLNGTAAGLLEETAAIRQPQFLRKITESAKSAGINELKAVEAESIKPSVIAEDTSTSELSKFLAELVSPSTSTTTTTTTTENPSTLFPTFPRNRVRTTTTATTTTATTSLAPTTVAALADVTIEDVVANTIGETLPTTTVVSTTFEPVTSTTRFPPRSSTPMNPSIFARSSFSPITFSLTTERTTIPLTTVVSTATEEVPATTSIPTTTSKEDEINEEAEEDPETISEAAIVNSFESSREGSTVRVKETGSRLFGSGRVRTTTATPVQSSANPVVTVRSQVTTPKSNTEAIPVVASTDTLNTSTESPSIASVLVTDPTVDLSKPFTFTIVTPEKTTVTITRTPPPSADSKKTSSVTAEAFAAAVSASINGGTTTSAKPPVVKTAPINSRSRVRPVTGNRADQITRTISGVLAPKNSNAAGTNTNSASRRTRPINRNIFNTVTEATTTATEPVTTSSQIVPDVTIELTTIQSLEDIVSTPSATVSFFNNRRRPTTTTTTTTTESSTTSTTTEAVKETKSEESLDEALNIEADAIINQRIRPINRNIFNRVTRPSTTTSTTEAIRLAETTVEPVKETSSSTTIAPSLTRPHTIRSRTQSIFDSFLTTVIEPTESTSTDNTITTTEEVNLSDATTTVIASIITTDSPITVTSTTTEASTTSTTTPVPSSFTRRGGNRRIGGRRPLPSTVPVTSTTTSSVAEETNDITVPLVEGAQSFGGRRPGTLRRRPTSTSAVPVENQVAVSIPSVIVSLSSNRRRPAPTTTTESVTTVKADPSITNAPVEDAVTTPTPQEVNVETTTVSTTTTTTPITTVEPSTTTTTTEAAVTTERPPPISTVGGQSAVDNATAIDSPSKETPTSVVSLFAGRRRTTVVPSTTTAATEAAEVIPKTTTTVPAIAVTARLGIRRRPNSPAVETTTAVTEVTSQSSSTTIRAAENNGGIASLFGGRRRTTTSPVVSEAPVQAESNAGIGSAAIASLIRSRRPGSRRTTTSRTTTTTLNALADSLEQLLDDQLDEDVDDLVEDGQVLDEDSSISVELFGISSNSFGGRRRPTTSGTPISTTELTGLLSGRRPGGGRRIDTSIPAIQNIVETETQASTEAAPAASGLASLLARRPATRTTTTTEATVLIESNDGIGSAAVASIISGRRPGSGRTTARPTSDDQTSSGTSNDIPVANNGTNGIAGLFGGRRPGAGRTTTARSVTSSPDGDQVGVVVPPATGINTLAGLLSGRRPGVRTTTTTTTTIAPPVPVESNDEASEDETPTTVTIPIEVVETPSTPGGLAGLLARRPSVRTTTTTEIPVRIESNAGTGSAAVASIISGRRPGTRTTTARTTEVSSGFEVEDNPSTSNGTPSNEPTGSPINGLAELLARRPARPTISTTTVAQPVEETTTVRITPTRPLLNRFRPTVLLTTPETLVGVELPVISSRTTRLLRNRTGNTPEVNSVSIQAQQIGERIRARGRSVSLGFASTVDSTAVTNATTTTVATAEVPITTAAPATTIETQADVTVVQQEPTTVAVPTALTETSSPANNGSDDSSITLFPEGAIVLGFSSSTEISEVIQIVGELPPRSSRNVSNGSSSSSDRTSQ